jgi:hypothetical protein
MSRGSTATLRAKLDGTITLAAPKGRKVARVTMNEATVPMGCGCGNWGEVRRKSRRSLWRFVRVKGRWCPPGAFR